MFKASISKINYADRFQQLKLSKLEDFKVLNLWNETLSIFHNLKAMLDMEM